MAVTMLDSSKVFILDVRAPALPVAELQSHHACVNAISWAPQGPRHVCSAGDDGQALIWKLTSPTRCSFSRFDWNRRQEVLVMVVGLQLPKLEFFNILCFSHDCPPYCRQSDFFKPKEEW